MFQHMKGGLPTEKEKLPDACYSVMPGTGELIIIKCGEIGYYRCEFSCEDKAENRQLADLLNGGMEISRAQESAMLHGSMFGWDVAAADPGLYDGNGDMILNQPQRPETEGENYPSFESEDEYDEEI